MGLTRLVADRPLKNARIAGWAAAAVLLCAPLIAMQVTDEVRWDGTDFLVFGAMLLVLGFGIEIAVRTLRTRQSRLIAIAALLLGFLWLWAERAVGVFTG